MNLGRLIEELEKQRQDAWVLIDRSPVPLAPAGVDSYRGYYEQLAIACEPSRNTSPKVSDLLAVLRDAIGKKFTGYKGGDYTMHEGTIMWLGNYGESGGSRVTGVRKTDYGIVYLTWDSDE